MSGGQDDRVYVYKQTGSCAWSVDAAFVVLGHNSNDTSPQPTYDGGIFKGTVVGKKLGVEPRLLPGENALAVIDFASGSVRGRIPTGWYPTSVSVSADGCRLSIVNSKSNAGPDPANGSTAAGNATDTTFTRPEGPYR